MVHLTQSADVVVAVWTWTKWRWKELKKEASSYQHQPASTEWTDRRDDSPVQPFCHDHSTDERVVGDVASINAMRGSIQLHTPLHFPTDARSLSPLGELSRVEASAMVTRSVGQSRQYGCSALG